MSAARLAGWVVQALVAAATLGCARAPVAPIDAGVDAAPDVRPRTCLVRSTICAVDANAVRRCNADGTEGAIIEDCGVAGTCSLGRCTTTACLLVEGQPTSAGCLFYGSEVADVTCDACESCYRCQPTSILATNAGSVRASVSLETREAGQTWTASQSITIDAGGAGIFTLPNRQVTEAGKAAARAYRLVSDMPITAVVIQGDDRNEATASSAGTQLLPVQGLGKEYVAIAYPQVDTAKLDATPGSRGGAGAITIVGTQDGTTVTFTAAPASNTVVDLGGFQLGAGDVTTLALDDGDVYQIFSDAGGSDLTGSRIKADKPIAVFTGNVSTTYGRSVDGVNSPDMASEEMLPVLAWGTSYVAAWLPPQTEVCATLFDTPGTGLWRIVAAREDTHVSFISATPLAGLPDQDQVIGSGRVIDLLVRGPANFTITATKPIAVMQGMDCEPTLSSAVAAESLMNDLFFALPVAFDHQLAIVRPTDAPVTLDGTPIGKDAFSDAGSGFEVARWPIAPCFAGPGEGVPASCQHHLHGRFGLTLRGMDGIAGYALTAPTWRPCFDTGCVVP